MINKPLIKIQNLSKKEGGALIFENVSFEINRFEFISLKGPSGCGKTTFLRILAGLIPPTGGKIFINGQTANSPDIIIPPHQRGMNLLFQDLALWPHLTGFAQLKFVWQSTEKGSLKERINKVCTDTGFPKNLLSKYPSQLSRGEQQRLALARTLIAQPELILLDEPLTALDQELRSQFINYLKKQKKEKTMTVIIVSHDLMTNVLKYDKELIYINNTFKEISNKK